MKKAYLLLISLLFITEVKAENLKYINCGTFELPSGIANIINIVVNLLYIGVPIIIILTGSIDFAKATIAKEKKEIEAFRPKFLNRLKSGTLVFLVFTIVKIFVGVVSSVTSSDINQCLECLVNHNSCGTEIESPNKTDVSTDQDYYVPEHNGPSLDGDSYEEEKENFGNTNSSSASTNTENNDSDETENETEDESTTNDTTTGD